MVQSLTFPVSKSPRRWSSWLCTISQSSVIKPRKGSPSVHKTLQKGPLQDPRKKEKRSAGNVLGLLVSMTNGFVCQLVCCFFNWKGNQDSILRNFPWDAWEHFLLDHISIIFPWCPHKTSSLCLLPCLPKGEKKNCHENIKEEGRTCLEELKHKKEQLRRWKKRPLTTKRKF